jgi:hypothetical protein
VFGVESGLFTVHFPLGQWTVDFACKPVFFFGGGLSKPLTFIPYALVNVVLLEVYSGAKEVDLCTSY